MCEALFHIIQIDFAKIRRVFSTSMSNQEAKNVFKNNVN